VYEAAQPEGGVGSLASQGPPVTLWATIISSMSVKPRWVATAGRVLLHGWIMRPPPSDGSSTCSWADRTAEMMPGPPRA
jgi:hypothetical protein